MTVKTRFAPSPTGMLHIGGARTALFCWLYARRFTGQFALRIEDTDRQRSTPEAINAIVEGMAWLGLDYDEGPVYQSERFSRYREVLQRLIDDGHAYYCYCSRERLEALRAAQLERKEKPRYDGRCRNLTEAPEDAAEAPVVRFRTPLEGETVIDDRVRGRVVINNAELDDLIIARADGTPTYNFVVVVDDMDMVITHVIRGDDHLNNTARQVNLLKVMGATPPAYAHVPMILDENGKKLSKRTGSASVMAYRDEGFLPHAVRNYLVRLGWAYGDQEIFSLDELIERFDVDDINYSASSLNRSKLLWLNQHYMKALPPEEVAQHLRPHLQRHGVDLAEGPELSALVRAQAERTKTLVEMAENSLFFYRAVQEYDSKAAKKNLRPEALAPLQRLRAALSALTEWRADALHRAVNETAEAAGLKLGKVAQPVRVAVSGGAVSPPIDVTLELLGRHTTLHRLQAAEGWIKTHTAAEAGG